MRKLFVVFFCLCIMLALCACSAQEAAPQEYVEYHVLSRYMRQPSGDVSVTEYSYDENWLPLRTETRLNGEFASAVDYVYSEDKTQLTMNYSSAIYEPYSTRQELAFNEDGRIIKAAVIENGEVTAVSEYSYDEAGREIKVLSRTEGYETVLERSYDEKGNLLCYTADTGYSVSRQDYSYDGKGRLLSIEYYQNDVLESVTKYSHEDNVRYGTVCDKDGNVQSKLMEVLDEAGNVLELERYSPSGDLQSYICTVYSASDGGVSGKLPEDA